MKLSFYSDPNKKFYFQRPQVRETLVIIKVSLNYTGDPKLEAKNQETYTG